MTNPAPKATGSRLRSAEGITFYILHKQGGCSSCLRPVLTACRKPLYERIGESGALHALLHRGNIIRDAPEFNHLMVQIGDGERRARIAVTGLADRSGIEQITRSRVQAQRGKIRSRPRRQMNHTDLAVAVRKSALVMCVSKKSYGAGRFEQAAYRLQRSKDVFILVVIRAMNHRQT